MPPCSLPPPLLSQLLPRHQSGGALSTNTRSVGPGFQMGGGQSFIVLSTGKFLIHAGFLPALTRPCQEIKSHCLCIATIVFS